jgi:hypothetical protein
MRAMDHDASAMSAGLATCAITCRVLTSPSDLMSRLGLRFWAYILYVLDIRCKIGPAMIVLEHVHCMAIIPAILVSDVWIPGL